MEQKKTQAKQRGRFDALDGLRGMAALVIALYHFSGGWGGYLAVEFFLVLSGFIFAHTILYSSRDIPLSRFILSRLARLYPMHLFALLALIPVSLLVGRGMPTYTDMPLFTLLQQLTLTHNIGLPPQALSWNRIAWMVSVIFWVNIVCFLIIRRNTRWWFLVLPSLAGFALIFFKSGRLDVTAGNYFMVINAGLVRGFSSVLLGILGYRIYLGMKERATVPGGYTALEMLVSAAIILAVLWRQGPYSRLDFLVPPLFTLLVVLMGLERGWLSRWTARFAFAGTLSYSMFLNQIALLMLVRRLVAPIDTGRWLELVLYLLTLPLYSWLTWRYIEEPMRKRGKRLIGK